MMIMIIIIIIIVLNTILHIMLIIIATWLGLVLLHRVVGPRRCHLCTEEMLSDYDYLGTNKDIR